VLQQVDEQVAADVVSCIGTTMACIRASVNCHSATAAGGPQPKALWCGCYCAATPQLLKLAMIRGLSCL